MANPAQQAIVSDSGARFATKLPAGPAALPVN